MQVTILDCAIKNPSAPCIERLKNHFTQVQWQTLDATKALKGDLDRALNSNSYIIFGSHSNVEDRLKWQVELARFMKEKILSGAPVLGLCFGHQLMADAFGGEVIKRRKGVASGPRLVEFTRSFGALKAGSTRTLGVSHSYEVARIPENFEVMAISTDCPTDGLRHKSLPYFGFQAHPEASEPFFQNECPGMDRSTRSLVMSEGLLVIEAFLQTALKVLA